jgi:hypothetical protein
MTARQSPRPAAAPPPRTHCEVCWQPVYANVFHNCPGVGARPPTGVAPAVVQGTVITPPTGGSVLLAQEEFEKGRQKSAQDARPGRVKGGKASGEARAEAISSRNRRIYDAHHVGGKTVKQIGGDPHLNPDGLSDSQIRRILSKPRP